MEYMYSVTYLKCQSCAAKNHCSSCSAEAAEALLRCGDVEAAEVDLQQKRVRISGGNEETLLDALEAVGILAG